MALNKPSLPSQVESKSILGAHPAPLPLTAGSKTVVPLSISGDSTPVYYHPPKGNGLA